MYLYKSILSKLAKRDGLIGQLEASGDTAPVTEQNFCNRILQNVRVLNDQKKFKTPVDRNIVTSMQ